LSDLSIPSEHQRGLQKLTLLSEQQAMELLSAIDKAARRSETDSLGVSKLPDIAGLSREDKQTILDTVESLYKVRANAEVPVDEFVSDICDFLQSDESSEFPISAADRGPLSDRLTKFLSIAALNQVAKATELRYEHERTLCHLRILTDARPVFSDDAVERPEAAVIFHMLKIAYHESHRVRETFFSLDENDLQDLKKAILRAELKAKSLREALASANMRIITPN
jgi:hypothetical protein